MHCICTPAPEYVTSTHIDSDGLDLFRGEVENVSQESTGRTSTSNLSNRQLDELGRVCNNLKAHKRAALNVKGQLEVVIHSGLSPHIIRKAESTLQSLLSKLRDAAKQSILDYYLYQRELAGIIDSTFDAIQVLVPDSSDSLLQEQIESERELYFSERKADGVALRRLLRECLRQEDLTQKLHDYPSKQKTEFIAAVQSEINSPDSNAEIEKYSEFIRNIQTLPTESQLASTGTWMIEMKTEKSRSSRLADIPEFTGKIVPKPLNRGVYCDIWKGELYGREIAVHTTVLRSKSTALLDNLQWATFNHPNVLPMIGICHNFMGKHDGIISPWMEGGSLSAYMLLQNKIDRLKLAIDIVSGVEYLHSLNPPWVHCILHMGSILVDGKGNAVLVGFAWKCFKDNQDKTWLGLRRSVPEFLNDDNAEPTKMTDIHTLASLLYEILVDDAPFSGMRSVFVMKMLSEGTMPNRPTTDLGENLIPDSLWEIITSCWSMDPLVRPSASDILKILQQMRTMSDLRLRDLTDDMVLEGGLRDVVTTGGFGDIRRGMLKKSRQMVALKSLCTRGGGPQPNLKNTKRFRREATIWNQLNHRNILPFLGIAEIAGLSTCLVSPWINNGNSVNYLAEHPDVMPLRIILGIAHGLEHLHTYNPPIIHGDLRGANVLISDEGEALLTDFGLAVIVEDLTRLPISSALVESGNPRWMAPELLLDGCLVSTDSDMWALGMVALELVTLDVPFAELKAYPQVIMAIHRKARPERPGEQALNRGLTDDLWALLCHCWSDDPTERPKVGAGRHQLEKIAG